jgi:AraC-like DNA-binding protein
MVIPEPHYFRRVAQLGPPIRFNQPVTQLVFDAAKLELPLVNADSAAHKLARERCEQELNFICGDLIARIRRLLTANTYSFGQAADALHISRRTLKRKLTEQGILFSSLVEQGRRDKALLLLRSSELSVQQIADRIGYSTPGNFVRAFQRWTGGSPGAYRRAIRRDYMGTRAPT